MEPNTNDTGKLIRNLALFIGIPLVRFLVVSYLPCATPFHKIRDCLVQSP